MGSMTAVENKHTLLAAAQMTVYSYGKALDSRNAEVKRLKASNAELLAALQKLLNFPNKKHFNGESYAEEHGEVIGECLAAIAKATKEKS